MERNNTAFEFFFIRHGQSVGNTKSDIVSGGGQNTPLSPLGEQQAHALGKFLQLDGVVFDHVRSSALTRARQTAEIAMSYLATPQSFAVDPGYNELSQGDFEGRSKREVYTPDQLRAWDRQGMDYRSPGPRGESQRMLQRRAVESLERDFVHNEVLRDSETAHRVAIFAHKMTIATIIQHILGSERLLTWRFELQNTSITRFRYDSDGWWPICVNDTAHLRHLA